MKEVIEQTVTKERAIRYKIECGQKQATFLWSSTPDSPLESSVDLKIRTDLNELSGLARRLSYTIQNGEVTFSSLDPYNRLLVYTCVRPTVKETGKVRMLAQLVLELNSWDAFYWASRFRELWWEHKNFKHLKRVARAFKLFFGLT